MNTKKQYFLTLLLSCGFGMLIAMPPYSSAKPAKVVQNRAACLKPTTQRDMDVNNVRAKLWNDGSMWFDHASSKAAYVVPKAGIDGLFPSSMYAGGIWVGGRDDNGTEYIAATTYGTGGGDWFAGPLFKPSPPPDDVAPANSIGTTVAMCKSWDKMFEVKGKSIDILKREYYEKGNKSLCSSSNPEVVEALANLRQWPARGNTDFQTIYGFPVPNQEMAPFFDNPDNPDGKYNPCDGDFPKISVRGCEDGGKYEKAQYGDQMFWWVYNDQGEQAPHAQTGGATMNMEVQVQAFAYASNDALNNMTFYRYKLLNRAAFDLKDTYMALWSDPDLGCFRDDYVGCINDVTNYRPITHWNPTLHRFDTIAIDTVTRSLGYVYNSKAVDDISCGTAIGYGTQIPILGVDYFRGPAVFVRDTTGGIDTTYRRELGMTSFSYYVSTGNSQTGDPVGADKFFNYMSGFWGDGTPYYPCGNAATPCNGDPTITTKFVFPGHPSDRSQWSMAQAGIPPGTDVGIADGDYRFLHTTGPFRLKAGATNEIISGIPWVPNQVYPRPALNEILSADDLAQNVFDNCFDILDGPDAPDLTMIEEDKALIMTLEAIGNNSNIVKVATGTPTAPTSEFRKVGESYEELSPSISKASYPNINDRVYKFEGYRVFQLVNGEVDFNKDQDDASKVREIFSVDLKNNITNIVNWEASKDVPGVFTPKLFKANNTGIKHTFKITRDQFGKDGGAMINHKKYYYKTISYGYNNYKTFENNNPGAANRGQATPYLVGRRGVDKTYIGVPRRTVAEAIGKTPTATYGDIPAIIRADGKGNGGLFLDLDNYTLSTTSNDIVQEGRAQGELGYKRGFGPVEVKIVDPLAITGGEFLLTLSRDSTGKNTTLTTGTNNRPVNVDSTYWELKKVSGNTVQRWVSERFLKNSSEQYIPALGISIRIAQPFTIKDDIANNYGFIGATITEKDTTKSWFSAVSDDDIRFRQFLGTDRLNWIRTGVTETDQALDPKQVYSKVLNGWFMPYVLCDCRPVSGVSTPAWQAFTTGAPAANFCATAANSVRKLSSIDSLNNVDIVFTPDTTKWSRCIVIETTPFGYATGSLTTEGNAKMGVLRPKLSVNKKGQPDGSGTYGYGWFPGYAVDVQTGKRLNVFFGESSIYDGVKRPVSADPAERWGMTTTGADMLFNPSTFPLHTDRGAFIPGLVDPPQVALGGFHNVYVTRDAYDGCAAFGTPTYIGPASPTAVPAPDVSPTLKAKLFSRVTWTSVVMPKIDLLPIEKGLIPTETTMKLRVNALYSAALGTNSNQTMPQYRFNLDKFVPKTPSEDEVAAVLQEVKVVPNPYYAFSEYETEANNVHVKIANLPPKCKVTIYALDGRFIRQFERNEDQVQPNTRSIKSDIEWDVRNSKGIPVASGMYLIHIDAPGIGERVIKWFGVTRAVDASRL